MALRFSTGLRNALLGGASQGFTAPSNVTGVTITHSLGNAAGAGTLAFDFSDTTLQWTPAGGSAGTAVDVSASGKYAIAGSAGLLVVTVVASSLPGSDKTDSITITAADGNGLGGTLDGCYIDIYSGAPPATADSAPIGTKLGTVSIDGVGSTGLTFAAPSAGSVSKTVAENWKAVGIAIGTAGWFRVRSTSDDNQAGTTYPRIDGTVAKTGADLNMSNTSVTVGSPHTIDTFVISIAAN